jgi:hypothetical protein
VNRAYQSIVPPNMEPIVAAFEEGIQAAEDLADAAKQAAKEIARVADKGGSKGGGSGEDNPFSRNKRALGGPVDAGVPYIVGERRAELFVPSTSGYVHPSVPAGWGGGMDIDYDRLAAAIANAIPPSQINKFEGLGWEEAWNRAESQRRKNFAINGVRG